MRAASILPQQRLKEIHERRSLRARRTDEALEAKLAKTSGEWVADPSRRDVKGIDYPKAKPKATPKVEKPYLEVIWTKNHLLKHKEFPIEKKEQAFNWWWRRSGGQIVIRNVEGVPSFTEDEATRRKSSLKWNPKKEGYKQTYQEWLKERGDLVAEPKRKLYKKDTYVYLPPETSGSKPYRVVEDKGALVKVAQWNFGMGQEHVSEVSRHMIKGKAKAPEPHMGGAVSYNKATGWMRISFPDKPPKHVRDGMKSQGFRYRPKSKTWAAKWNTEREDYATALVGKMTEVNIKPDWQKKAEIAEAQALKHHKESDERFERTWKSMKAIPLGQPILVGHHSEKSHRAHLKRIDKGFEIARREKDIAEKLEGRAKRYRRKAVGEAPGLIYRRIKKLEAEERGWNRSLKRLREEAQFAREHPKLAEKYGRKARPDEIARSRRYLKNTQERLKIEREKYNASGGIPAEKLQLKKGDLVRTQIGNARVVKVNPKTVTVKSSSTGWSLKLDKSHIYGKVE